jgi:hypothetical protein
MVARDGCRVVEASCWAGAEKVLLNPKQREALPSFPVASFPFTALDLRSAVDGAILLALGRRLLSTALPLTGEGAHTPLAFAARLLLPFFF